MSVAPTFPVPDYPLHAELVVALARAVVKHPERQLSWEKARHALAGLRDLWVPETYATR